MIGVIIGTCKCDNFRRKNYLFLINMKFLENVSKIFRFLSNHCFLIEFLQYNSLLSNCQAAHDFLKFFRLLKYFLNNFFEA